LEKAKSENLIEELGPEAGPQVRRIRIITVLTVLLIIVLFALFVSGVLSIREVWNKAIFEPMLNLLILLSNPLGRNLGLSIVVVTIFIRVITLPIALRQLRTSKISQEIRPQIEELSKTYEKDPLALRRALTELYRRSGYNPMGCLFNTIIQFPLWFALYWCVIQTLAYVPDNLAGLSSHLYPWHLLRETLPLNDKFLWLNLVQTSIIMAFLVFATLWMAQKMSPQPPPEYRKKTSTWAQWALPILFGLFALILPSGLALYWVTSNTIQLIIQYRVTGWGALKVPWQPSGITHQADKAPTSGGTAIGGESEKRAVTPENKVDKVVGDDKGKTPDESGLT
jgi:YidC/Oxa1 family membrane protein insertase